MKKQIINKGISVTLSAVRSNPEKALPKIMALADLLAHGNFPAQREAFREAIEDEESNSHKMLLRVMNGIDPDVLQTVISNFIINANMEGWPIQNKLKNEYGCNIPWAVLLDPTSACNLHCKGCWAADYGNKLSLSFEEIDDIIKQGKELGIYIYIYTGGEPLVRKKDLIRLCEKHSDCVFLCFTNATLIDEDFCKELLRVKNFIPAVSLEGDRISTDSRRGEGTYDKVISAMKLMKSNKLPFGISCCYTSANFDQVSSDEFLEEASELGAMFIWYFHYMPVGHDADTELMVSPQQREEMYHKVREFRDTKDVFVMDFQNDGEYVQGCIAGGRRYLHINAAGDVDLCVFVHFSDSNIREKTLLESLRAPLFMAYHDNQPFSDNMLRPCPMLENPDRLREMIEKTGAHSTDLEHEESVEELCSRCDRYSEAWLPFSERIWEEDRRPIEFSR